MKKLIIILTLSMLVSVNLSAKDKFFNNKLRKELKQYLVDHKDAGYPEAYDPYNLAIHNLLTKKLIEKSAGYDYGIYSFCGPSTHITRHILLKNKDSYTLIEMPGPFNQRSLQDAIEDIFVFFDENKEINRGLMPHYVKAIVDVYLTNGIRVKENEWLEMLNQKK